MTPEQLKASILQMAIQGKLVEQRAEEGTAEELYQQIQKEKQKLIKEGKIKKEKPLEDIKEDEIPFDIPESWKWVRLGQCGCFERGSGIKKDETSAEGFPCVRYGQLYTTYKTRFSEAVSHVPQKIFNGCKKAHKSDILMALTGENEYDIALAVAYEGEEELAIGGDMTRFFNHCMNPLYLTYVLNSRYGILCKSKMATGNIIVHISNDKLATIPIPLPHLEEQNRIVAKIEELLPYVDRYAEAYEKLEQFNAKFPEDMKKSILQYAIQGKLVEQRPEEGTAEELYQQIQKEKQKLIKEGKIKKEKPLAEISDDEIPFEIPESWKWVRLNDFGVYKKGPFGSALTKSMFVPKSETTVKVYEQKNAIQKDATLGEYYITRKYFEEKMKGFEVEPGDVIVSCAGTIGETYIMPEKIEQGIINQALMRMSLMPSVYKPYFLLFFDVVLKETAKEGSKGSAIKNIPPFEVLKNYLVPLPPLEEQHRIIAKVNELLTYCDRLVK